MVTPANPDARYQLHPAYGNFDLASWNATFDIDAGDFQIGGTAVKSTATEMDERALTFELTIGTGDTKYIVIPWTCTVTRAYTVIDAAIDTGDETITLENDESTAMTNGVITIANSGSAAGDVDSCTPTANNTFAAGEKMEVIIGGESGGGSATLTVVCQIT